MFDYFLDYFSEKAEVTYSGDMYHDFIMQLGGRRFGRGLFNSFSYDNVNKWTQIITEAYPKFKDRFAVFGYDWLGRCFGIDTREKVDENILMFEIGTNNILHIPRSFERFLNVEIPLHSDACLAEPFFHEWMEYSKTEIQYGRCAGYKIPLFLGGEDAVTNLEDSDMEVYWGIMAQVKN